MQAPSPPSRIHAVSVHALFAVIVCLFTGTQLAYFLFVHYTDAPYHIFHIRAVAGHFVFNLAMVLTGITLVKIMEIKEQTEEKAPPAPV